MINSIEYWWFVRA